MLADEFCNAIVGARITDIRRLDWTWLFSFDSGWTVTTETYWRVLTKDAIAVSQTDDGQKFGLPKPVDAATCAQKALTGAAMGCSIDRATGDLSVQFCDGGLLQVFNTSAGYEGWRTTNSAGQSLIATGGGRVVAV